jgi:hypothetical protein
MKSLLLALVAVSFMLPACAQNRKSPHETVNNENVSVTYGRPAKKGRDIFGALVPYGKVWRAGADEATEITFKKDGSLGGKPVKAGTYTLFVIPNATEWTLILNGQLKQWGAYEYDKHKDKDVLKVSAPVGKTSGVVENFTIRLDGGNLILEWDTTQATVPVS